ncbi:hypothetical protein F5H01DRAFT_342239 [Linnemannia elongata]|nr:hypothetical protein F5H01DRAFT_359169 [Linnemannia elongata]KAK5817018.1 hypothetical protein F5H01DRAFT_342239 [Linnemannia elongata]
MFARQSFNGWFLFCQIPMILPFLWIAWRDGHFISWTCLSKGEIVGLAVLLLQTPLSVFWTQKRRLGLDKSECRFV